MNKRILVIIAFVFVVVIAAVVAVVLATRSNGDEDGGHVPGKEARTSRQRALDVLDSVPLVDGHNDLPWQYRNYQNQIDKVCIKWITFSH